MKKIFLLIALLLVCFWQINVKADDETKEIITTDPEVAEIDKVNEEQKEVVEVKKQEEKKEDVEIQKQDEVKEEEKKEEPAPVVKAEAKAEPTRGEDDGDDDTSDNGLDPEVEAANHTASGHRLCIAFIDTRTVPVSPKVEGSSCMSSSGGSKISPVIRNTSFEYQGSLYVFDGWYDEDGNKVTTYYNGDETRVRVSYTFDNTKCVQLNYYVRWKEMKAPKIIFKYIDSVSTGTGSWSNSNGSTAAYTHTFSKPDEPDHYKFLYWKLDSNEYGDGDKFTFSFSGMTYDEVKEFNADAYWQADVTLNLYDDKDLLSSESSFESVSVGEDPKKDGYKFLGWVDENGNAVTETTFYPNEKGTKPEPIEINLYAKWEKVINITITKEWADDDNPNRPTSVTVKLIKDDEDYEEVELTEENWRYTFEDMPVNNEDGSEIVYNVEETNIPEGYVPAYEMEETDEGLVFTVHNVLGQGDGEPDKPTNNPQTGDNIILYLITFVVSSTGLVILKRKYNFDE